jgi:type IV pilus assembly protein PilM
MVVWPTRRRHGPIGIDIGSRSVKLVQLASDFCRLVEAARWDFPASFDELSTEQRLEQVTEALLRAREGRRFRGRDAVVCLNHEHVFVQNLRLPKLMGEQLDALVEQQSSQRLPFPAEEAEIRFLDAGEVRQSDNSLREVIVTACHRPALRRFLDTIENSKLHPVAVDIEPSAIVRSYSLQFNRDEDQDRRVMFVHVGYSNSVVVIAHGHRILFVKYIQSGGKQMDDAVAARLKMSATEASALRRHNGDRRRERQDPDVSRGIAQAIRPVVERLANEISLCSRYHSVTFRGQPICRMVLSGGEATQSLSEALQVRSNVPCLMSEPLRRYSIDPQMHPLCQWDIAMGLAARGMNRSGVSRSDE